MMRGPNRPSLGRRLWNAGTAIIVVLATVSLAVGPSAASDGSRVSQAFETSAERHTPRPLGSTEAAMGYYEYLPPSYGDPRGGSPLLIAANGYGENGDGSPEGLDAILITGIPKIIAGGAWPLDRPFVVLSTQHVEQPPGLGGACGAPWAGTCMMQRQHDAGHPPESFCTTPVELHDFIDYATAEYDVNPARVYVTGLSCGGFGVWEYLAAYGDEQIAAAVPIAGDGRLAWATSGCAIAEVPVWAIHGEIDDVVDPIGSIEPIAALSACPGMSPERAKLSIYPQLTHEGWDQAYDGSQGDDVYGWMLRFTRAGSTAALPPAPGRLRQLAV